MVLSHSKQSQKSSSPKIWTHLIRYQMDLDLGIALDRKNFGLVPEEIQYVNVLTWEMPHNVEFVCVFSDQWWLLYDKWW